MDAKKTSTIDILLVEDSATQAQTLQNLLENDGFEVRVAENGRVAIELIKARKPDLILTDIVMPDMNGFELCSEIKGREETLDIPVILLTSLTNPEDIIEGLACGADNFITKPFQQDYLLNHIQQILANRRLFGSDRVRIGVEVIFAGKKRFITANQQQMLSLLLSSYEAASRRNNELIEAQDELRSLNDRLEDLVEERTAELIAERDFAEVILDTAQAIILVLDKNGRIIRFNPYFAALSGYKLDEIKGRDFFDIFFTGNDLVRKNELLYQCLTGSPITGSVNTIVAKNGEKRHIEWFANAIRNGNGETAGLLAVGQDITERLKVDKRIRHLNRVLRAIRHIHQQILMEKDSVRLIDRICHLLVEHRGYWGAWVLLADRAGRYCGSSYAGFGGEQICLKEKFEKKLLPACANCLSDNAVEFARIENEEERCWLSGLKGKYEFLCNNLEHEGRFFGRIGVLVERHIDIEDEERELLSETADDVAFALFSIEQAKAMTIGEERRSLLEAQLHQSQKIEAIGQLAGGVAHDFNNMLQIINANAEMAMLRLDPTSDIYNNIREIVAAGERSAKLTRQLLAFARKQTIAPRLLDLNETVGNILKLLKRLVGENIALVLKPCAQKGQVNMDPAQIDQILANLVVNARDAIAGNGNIFVEVSNVEFLPDDAPLCSGWQPGSYVLLRVEDDGCGMNQETLARIFEPFFTTKEADKGTGLGLPTVYGIVSQNKGFINVESEPGKGTIFSIYLPAVAGDAGLKKKAAAADSLPHGSEFILVVEDEPALLNICTNHLESLGYRVLGADRPETALQLVKEYGEKIDLLLTDVLMPQMNGRELFLKISSSRPGMRVVFMSGYTSDTELLCEKIESGFNFLQKPFSKKILAKKIRDVLDAG